ncbi:glycoside hydrolase family 25 protein [Amycolatopsis acidiphila]|uniref:Lysozyme n=1 Tax=Amycolatopsis acidiphila TaxID=715473 RepID=A0A558ABB8_9PSEU|nr:glycoside hydrolase family 25 protein [Amycolatopsis acidiphila]TVT21568.1 hypothetical protein FNH06_16515 [Amycolatopsis acidiphila]UIJ59397.1 glycoside hydrolase family 25 protein [Amycolatopsis acidiphila]GHG96995.1 hypothetical protein GCM10017788_76280 [Amycolatopsis acidiphila]
MATTFGLDISHYQSSSLSLAQTRAEGCEFVFLKAAEGSTYTDPTFGANLAEARAAGMLAAAYVYQRDYVSAQAHVDRVAQVVPKDVPVIPDVETNSGDVALTRDLVDRLRAAGYRVPLLYLPRWYWQQLGSPSLAGLPPLWSSRYPDTAPGSLAEQWAKVPASYWDGYGGLDVAVLQFTSTATIAGYSPLDADAFRGTRVELAAVLGYTAPNAVTNNDEETTMLVPAGTNEHVVLPCAGRPLFWYLYTAFGQRVTVHQCAYVMPTRADSPDAEFVPNAGWGWDPNVAEDHVFDPDRPGPIDIPRHPDGRQPAGVSLRYTAGHSFTAYVG